MKILFLVTQSKESPSGGGRYWPLAKALHGLNHQVTIVALHHNYRELQNREYIEDGVRVKYVGQMHVRKSGNQKTYFNPVLMVWIALLGTFKLFWSALRTECDVIHVCKTQPMNGLAAWFVRLIRGVPVYLDSDDYEAVNNRFRYDWQQKIVAWFENWLPSIAAGITVGTSYTANHFKSLGYPEEGIFIVFNGVERKRFGVLEREDVDDRVNELRSQLFLNGRQAVVYVGSISLTSHALDVLIPAFAEVVEANPKALLLLVGSGEDMDHLREMVKALGIREHVKFIGRKPINEIPLYYRLGIVTVDPMHASLSAESSLSLKLVESVVAGVPCVTGDIGDRRMIVDGAGLAVEPDNPTALAAGILKIMHEPELHRAMTECSLKIREEFFWDSRVRAFVKVYS